MSDRPFLLRWPGAITIPAVLAAGGAVVVPFVLTASPTVSVSGISEGAVYGARAASALTITVHPHGAAAGDAKVSLDGRALPTQVSGDVAIVRPGHIADGRHTLKITVPGHMFRDGASVVRQFSVDTTPPSLAVRAPKTADSLRAHVTVTGVATGAAKVTAAGRPVALHGDRFSVTFPAPPAAAKIVAIDEAGNSVSRTVSVAVHHPVMRGVHLTGYGWNADVLRNPVLDLARAHKINTVELDIKEEDGYVNFDTSVKLAHKIGAIRVLYDPRKVVRQLHAMGVRVVGRIVCFRDPKLAAWAWSHGHHSWDVLGPNGQPYDSSHYGAAAFTNWASPAVRTYNIDLAVEAAKLGFDDVMYDYVRRPDGPLETMRFPGAHTSAPDGVAQFVKESSGPVRDHGAYLGLAVFGVSATRPKEVGQEIGVMAKYVDYVAPMVYPSHWGPGEYGVANPNAQPYAIVNRSLKDFQKKVAGTDADVFPWLQDFSLGVTYGVPEVDAQIQAAADDGIHGFLLWDAGCVYHAAALTPM